MITVPTYNFIKTPPSSVRSPYHGDERGGGGRGGAEVSEGLVVRSEGGGPRSEGRGWRAEGRGREAAFGGRRAEVGSPTGSYPTGPAGPRTRPRRQVGGPRSEGPGRRAEVGGSRAEGGGAGMAPARPASRTSAYYVIQDFFNTRLSLYI